MPASFRQAILEDVKSRLARIAAADGFWTEAGASVLLGELPTFGSDDPTSQLAIMPAEETVALQKGRLVSTLLPIEIHCLASVDLDEAWVAVEALIADVLAAMEATDVGLEGGFKYEIRAPFVRTFEREKGSTMTGAIVTYTFQFSRAWGTP